MSRTYTHRHTQTHTHTHTHTHAHTHVDRHRTTTTRSKWLAGTLTWHTGADRTSGRPHHVALAPPVPVGGLYAAGKNPTCAQLNAYLAVPMFFSAFARRTPCRRMSVATAATSSSLRWCARARVNVLQSTHTDAHMTACARKTKRTREDSKTQTQRPRQKYTYAGN
jgi:hypothetical protein